MNNPKQLTFPWNKDNKSSFDNFYVTKSNKQLLLTLQDEVFNDDLLIFGTKDSGKTCLLYTSPSPRDATLSRMPSSA